MEIKNYSFIVRIWNEAAGNEIPNWRGSIEKVGNDGKMYFSHIDDVVRFINENIGLKAPAKVRSWDSFVQRIKGCNH